MPKLENSEEVILRVTLYRAGKPIKTITVSETFFEDSIHSTMRKYSCNQAHAYYLSSGEYYGVVTVMKGERRAITS